MAKRLKMRLDDEKVYTFTTLTMRQQKVIRKRYKELDKEEKKINELIDKLDEGKALNEEEETKIDKIDELKEEQLIEVIRMSLAKQHAEFVVKGANEEEIKVSEKMINDSLLDLLDGPTLKRASSFALTGTIPLDVEEKYDVVEVIDLTKSEEG